MATRHHEVGKCHVSELDLLKPFSTPRQEIELAKDYLLFSLNHPKGVLQLQRNHGKCFTMPYICNEKANLIPNHGNSDRLEP